jgi:hypothetical protein
MDLYSPHVDWKKGYTTAHPTTGFAEAMTLQYIYENIVPSFNLLFSPKISEEGFHSVIVNIICQCVISYCNKWLLCLSVLTHVACLGVRRLVTSESMLRT